MDDSKVTTIWLTARYHDAGIEEVDAIEPLCDENLVMNGGHTISHYWYREGLTWHRKKEDALAQAEKFRRERIAKAAAELARLAALPPPRALYEKA